MAKKTLRRAHHRHTSHQKKAVRTKTDNSDMLVVVRGWMFVVAFALMLGIGAVTGTFVSRMLNADVPTVAGVQTQR